MMENIWVVNVVTQNEVMGRFEVLVFVPPTLSLRRRVLDDMGVRFGQCR
jgi:hypothetical protein